jgi:hypothetical protein
MVVRYIIKKKENKYMIKYNCSIDKCRQCEFESFERSKKSVENRQLFAVIAFAVCLFVAGLITLMK